MLSALIRDIRSNGDPRCILGQFRVGPCKADLVVIDGTSTAWEVKSDLDGLGRLPAQLAAYGRFFARVSVLAGDRHVERVIAVAPKRVGVCALSEHGEVQVLREAATLPEQIDPATVAACIRRAESVAILRLLGVPFPDMPNTLVHREILAAFSRLPPRLVHDAMVEILGKTRAARAVCAFADALPPSLSALAFTVRMTPSERQRVLLSLAIEENTGDVRSNGASEPASLPACSGLR
jgi:hypothetical protein